MPRGSLRLLFLYDVGEEIDLARARAILGSGESRKTGPLTHQPRYLGFEEPPSLIGVDRFPLEGDTLADAEYKAFSYGVFSLSLCVSFQDDWEPLITHAVKLLEDAALARLARRKAEEVMARIGETVRGAYPEWLSEDYLIVEIEEPASAEEILRERASEVARLVRGDTLPLSKTEEHEVLAGTMSCYPSDVMVVGWAAALVVDSSPEGREGTRQLLEYANSQLLEFRHYDARLGTILRELYALMQQKRGFFRRWRLVTEAERLNHLRLELAELVERSENSLRLLGDMFYARAYKLISARIGLNDYRHLVDEKLKTAGEMYEFLVDQFNHQRAFILEAVVVLILIIDLVVIFVKPH